MTHRSSCMSWRSSGSHGALPLHCDSAEEIQVHLAWGCRKARLHPCFWINPDSQTFLHENSTQETYWEQLRQRLRHCNYRPNNFVYMTGLTGRDKSAEFFNNSVSLTCSQFHHIFSLFWFYSPQLYCLFQCYTNYFPQWTPEGNIGLLK